MNVYKMPVALLIVFLFSFCKPPLQHNETISERAQIVVGAARFQEYTKQLEHKKVGIVVNHTSIVNETHLVDTLISLGVAVERVFSPEHGFRGTADAGEKVENARDPRTQLPVISLYGKRKKPTSEDLSGLDIVIFDLQDVGTRFYTYISTMHYVMEACAEQNKRLIILDRPNPNGDYVAGPILQPEFQSFVGLHPISYCSWLDCRRTSPHDQWRRLVGK